MEKIKSKNQGDSWMEISNFDSYSRPDSLVFSVVIIALVTEVNFNKLLPQFDWNKFPL